MRSRLVLLGVLGGLLSQPSPSPANDVVIYEPQPYYVVPPLYTYQSVFATPPTVLVQRPVYVAHPVVVAEPVFVEAPVAVPVVVAPTYAPIATSVRYRGPLFPFGHRDKYEYRVRTPYGTHKYKSKRSWLDGSTRFEYDFDD